MADWTTEIKKKLALFEQYHKARDFTAFSSMYTEDCLLMRPGRKLLRGRQGVLDEFSPTPAKGVDTISLTLKEVIPSRDTAVERSTYVLLRPDGSVYEHGKYVVVWKRVGDDIKIYTDIWNLDEQ